MSIFIATHKPYFFPVNDYYKILHVGAVSSDLTFSDFKDSSGDNISYKNSNYSELTAYYWIWKNTNDDTVGLVHYRRYFLPCNVNKNLSSVIQFDREYVEDKLKKFDIILPEKRNYYIESIWTHYKNAHYESDLLKCRDIISSKYPDYLSCFDVFFSGKKLFLYNMFVTRKEIYNEYCAWLFDILFELEKSIDLGGYSSYQQRVYGFLSERLFNVWVAYKGLSIFYAPVLNLEGDNIFRKGYHLVKRKVLNELV